LSTSGAVLAALAVTIVLAVLHFVAPRIRSLPGVPERATGSFAGGLAVAYVFLHLLPELAEGNKTLGELLDAALTHTPLTDLGIFLVALAGFTLFYGLERLADRTGHLRSAGAEHVAPMTRKAFQLHVGSFFVYNALITYTMPLRFRTGVIFALLFSLAMGLHFVLTDRGLEEHYRGQFGRGARATLAAGLVAGWAAAALFAPTSAVLVALLTAFLAGSILLNVFKEELPSAAGGASFMWFTAGLVGYSVLLAVVTYLEE
jgi:hypothetical protein